MALEPRRDLYALAFATLFVCSWTCLNTASTAIAQDAKISINPELAPPKSFRAAEELKLELNPAYTSRAIGKKQNWQMDRGQFQDNAPVGTSVYDPALDSYSGVRFRLPRQR